MKVRSLYTSYDFLELACLATNAPKERRISEWWLSPRQVRPTKADFAEWIHRTRRLLTSFSISALYMSVASSMVTKRSLFRPNFIPDFDPGGAKTFSLEARPPN